MNPPVPFQAGPYAVEPGWVDYNGHLNMAYYHVLFDRAADAALAAHGFGEDWRVATGASYFTVEAHVRYRAEVPPDASLLVAVTLAGHDGKRFHLAETLTSGGVLHATCEQLLIRVDVASRRVAPFTATETARLDAWAAAEAGVPAPNWLGAAIRLPGR